jgi:hypothetical protein
MEFPVTNPLNLTLMTQYANLLREGDEGESRIPEKLNSFFTTPAPSLTE